MSQQGCSPVIGCRKGSFVKMGHWGDAIGCRLLVTMRPLWRQSPACLLFVDWWESCSASCVSMEEAPWEGPETTLSPPNSLNLTAPVPTHLAITAQPRWAAVFAIKSWSLTFRCQSLKKSIIKCIGTDGWQFHLIHLSLALLCFFYLKKIIWRWRDFFPWALAH